ncbi:MAG: hypothetical protein C4518_17780 [Desulfobacteraceae bacterium]|nr:MAG: hypothetical protein C4518_17780 [Desulfobacteraceae bacterium]
MAATGVYEKRLFFIGALWNWSAAMLFFGLSVVNKELLSYFHKIPETMLWYYGFLAAVFIFGIGYFWISHDVWRNRNIIKMGIIGKTAVFLLFFAYLVKGEITLLLFMAGCVDLIFTILFIKVLLRTPK